MASDEQLGQLIHQSSILLASDPENSLALLISNVEKYQSNPIFLQTLAESYLENNDVESAYTILSNACELDPEAKHGTEKFFHLGQIVGGTDGIQLLEVGIAKLIQQLDGLSKNGLGNDIDESMQILLQAYQTPNKIKNYLLTKLAQGISALVEIWMTDLCMETKAELECEKWTTELIDLNPKNPEAHSLLASVRISQERREDAVKAIQTAWELFQVKKERLENLANNEIDEDGDSVDADEAQLEWLEMLEPIITLSKYAIECGMFDIASDIISAAREINEDSIESCYIEGFSNYLEALRIQNNVGKENGWRIGREFENYTLNKNIEQNDDSWENIHNSRLALSSAFKLLQNTDLAEQVDEELKVTINQLLQQVGGFLLKEKDTSGVNESNWESEIQE